MNNKHSIHWLEDIFNKISERQLSKVTLATGKTPSGHIHIGILREMIICDSLRKIFEKQNLEVKFYLFIDDLDAAKRFPKYIEKKFQKQHLGKPFYLIPCPFNNCGCKSYAYHFGNELISTFNDFGIKVEAIWTNELYKRKEMQQRIKIALENTEIIKQILKKYILPTLDEVTRNKFIEMQKVWMPAMVICEKCSKIQSRRSDGSIIPNRIISYEKDKDQVTYKCPACGYNGQISIFSGKLKLNWRVDWPAKWSIYRTTCEPAGKDHSVKGGSYDTGLEICQKIFNYVGPIKVPYEYLRLGERDMGTSKGIVFTPKKYLEIADPELFRMLILRTNPLKHISLRIEEIPQYQDYYEKMEKIYYNIEELESKADKEFFTYIYPLTKVNDVPETKKSKISIKLLIILTQMQKILPMEKLYEKVLLSLSNEKQELTLEEFKVLLKRTENWIKEVKKILENIKDEKSKKYIINKIGMFDILDKIDIETKNKLNKKQLEGLSIFKDFLLKNKDLESDVIQNKIFTIAKEDLKIPPKKFFESIYYVLLGQNSGPRLGPFIEVLDRDWLIDRLNQILD